MKSISYDRCTDASIRARLHVKLEMRSSAGIYLKLKAAEPGSPFKGNSTAADLKGRRHSSNTFPSELCKGQLEYHSSCDGCISTNSFRSIHKQTCSIIVQAKYVNLRKIT